MNFYKKNKSENLNPHEFEKEKRAVLLLKAQGKYIESHIRFIQDLVGILVFAGLMVFAAVNAFPNNDGAIIMAVLNFVTILVMVVNATQTADGSTNKRIDALIELLGEDNLLKVQNATTKE